MTLKDLLEAIQNPTLKDVGDDNSWSTGDLGKGIGFLEWPKKDIKG